MHALFAFGFVGNFTQPPEVLWVSKFISKTTEQRATAYSYDTCRSHLGTVVILRARTRQGFVRKVCSLCRVERSALFTSKLPTRSCFADFLVSSVLSSQERKSERDESSDRSSKTRPPETTSEALDSSDRDSTQTSAPSTHSSCRESHCSSCRHCFALTPSYH